VPEKAESLVVGPAPGIVSRVDILGFREIENQDFGVRGAELHDINSQTRDKEKSEIGKGKVKC
jgi:hypothetical protein